MQQPNIFQFTIDTSAFNEILLFLTFTYDNFVSTLNMITNRQSGVSMKYTKIIYYRKIVISRGKQRVLNIR